MQLIESKPLFITGSRSKLAFTTTGGGHWKVWDRFISLGDEQLFHIGNICDTCEFFFRRVTESTIVSFEIERAQSKLEAGVIDLDSIAPMFSEVVPNGKYIVALFEAQPQMAGAEQSPDYFLHEQRLTWPDCDDGPSPVTS